ncbi:MAG TPA: hypothetical protein VF062_18285, partial [Candidatus Limnocylindrales bacterium]
MATTGKRSFWLVWLMLPTLLCAGALGSLGVAASLVDPPAPGTAKAAASPSPNAVASAPVDEAKLKLDRLQDQVNTMLKEQAAA